MLDQENPRLKRIVADQHARHFNVLKATRLLASSAPSQLIEGTGWDELGLDSVLMLMAGSNIGANTTLLPTPRGGGDRALCLPLTPPPHDVS